MDPEEYILKIRSAVELSDHPLAPDPEVYRPTSVMALFMFDRSPELLFIQKADTQGYPWRNQMAFPGGHRDKDDPNSLETALREVREELDIRPENVEVIGSLGHFQTINNRDIQAFAGVWNQKDRIEFDHLEISRIFTIPLDYLIRVHRKKKYHITRPNIMDLTYPYKDVVIWGATAKILFHLLEILMKH
ncbi:NUDIX hydrolase [Desulfospira joergensenii]|uniref:NUDIX hydrolase n=1 Tax=Desulfospira joergensenii TaxID=53329 RepID=UPI0003B745FD|nr:CoA pyrophosphatase [Desulfospira joergensenii]